MKQRKLSSLLAVAISLEMIITPALTYAQSSTNTALNINAGLQAVGSIAGLISGNSALNTQTSADMANLQNQQTPSPDKYFNLQRLSTVPGLMNYLSLHNINPQMLNCQTLATTLYEAKPEVCRIGVTNDRMMDQTTQMNQAFGYYNQYFQVEKIYKNFSADSNSEGQAFGIGCMKNAMNILNGFFKYRLDELDKLVTNLEAMNNKFREASRSDLDAIEESVAVLDGDSALADKVKSRKPDLFDFEKRFSDAACKSMFTGTQFNTNGLSAGLNGINQNIKQVASEKNGKFSGESYSKAHTAVVEDINSLADKVGKQVELNFAGIAQNPAGFGQFLRGLPSSVASANGVNSLLTADMFSDAQSKFLTSVTKYEEQKSAIKSELASAGISGDSALGLLGNLTSGNFESEVTAIQNQIKNNCLATTLSGSSSIDTILSRIWDPAASQFANKNAANYLKDKLKQILENSKSSPERKLAELQNLEASTGSKYYLRMQNSYEVQEVGADGQLTTRVESPSTQRTPSVYFSDVIKNCDAQFKVNKLDTKLSGAQVIQNLRTLNTNYKALAQNQANDMKTEMRKRLIECASPDDANNTVPGSCTPERFNTSAAGFCANAALSCSNNMQACSAKTDSLVKEIKEQKTARVNNYKNLLQKNKQDIVKIFDSALASYMKDAQLLRSTFGAGFASPANILREVPENQRYLTDFQQATSKSVDGKLLLEDPDKYVEMFKNNIGLLKKSVKDQQDQILGGESVGKNGGLLADHIEKTRKNYETVAKEASRLADTCLRSHDNALQAANEQRNKQQEEMNKRNSELGEKREKFCRLYSLANSNPQGACSQNITDIVDGGLTAANAMSLTPYQRQQNQQSISDFAARCNLYAPAPENSNMNAATICLAIETENPMISKEDRAKYAANCAIIKKGCEDVNSPPSSTTGLSTVQVSPACQLRVDNAKEGIMAAYNLASKRVPTPYDVNNNEDMPAICAAGDNSGAGYNGKLNPGGQFLQQVMQSMGRQ